MTKDRKILVGVCIAVGILLLAQTFTIFRDYSRNDKSDSQELLDSMKETIKAVKGERDAWQTVADRSTETIQQLIKRDSAITSHYTINQSLYKRIDEKISNIPAYISRISTNDDSIRAAFARHANNVDSTY